jgi:hypothetical protein
MNPMWAQLFQENQAIMQSQQSLLTQLSAQLTQGTIQNASPARINFKTPEPIEKLSRTLCEQMTFCINLYAIRKESTRFCVELPCLSRSASIQIVALFSPTLFRPTQSPLLPPCYFWNPQSILCKSFLSLIL